MADYKRLVSYMYLYEEGKKRNNIGYARVESRNGQCKYTIHVTALGLNEKQLKVYSFKRNSSGIEGILLGSLLIKNNTGDFKILTDAAHIMNSPYGLDDMGGIILVFSERKFFAAEWDNKPITMSMVAGIVNRTNNKKGEAHNNPESNKTPETVKIPESNKTPETDKTTVTIKTPETDKIPETMKAPETDKTPETMKAPETDKTTVTIKNPETVKSPETLKTPEEIKAATLAEVLFEYSKSTEEVIPKDNKDEMDRDKSLKDLLTPNFNRIVEQDEEQEIQPKDANNKTIDSSTETFFGKPVDSERTDSNPDSVDSPAAPAKDLVNAPIDYTADNQINLVESPMENAVVIPDETLIQSPIENPPESFISNSEESTNYYPVEDSTGDTENEAIKQPEAINEGPLESNLAAAPAAEIPQPSEAVQPPADQSVNQPQESDTKTEPATEGLSNNKPIFDDHPLAKQIYHNFPKMYPFEDNEIAWCARIEPKDIGMLPMDLWGLGNNSFLLHGYYSYRHLIFARVNDKNGQNYILGVPGIYHNREKFMAKMFGFENFKCAKRKPQRTGEFGYWYIPVLLNRGN